MVVHVQGGFAFFLPHPPTPIQLVCHDRVLQLVLQLAVALDLVCLESQLGCTIFPMVVVELCHVVNL